MATSELDCPFCEIVHGEDFDARIIYRGDRVIAFFPTEPAVLGHTMVVPRQHVSSIWDLESDLASTLGAATVAIAKAVRLAIQPAGMNIIQSNGAAASQTVMHLHIHVVPRWDDDAIGRIWPPESNYSESQKDRAWDAIRRAAAVESSTLPISDVGGEKQS